jgi:RHS repeat-associated protein
MPLQEQSAEKGGSATGSIGAAPVISLPKGGGAIRGIGEKFAANPVTGTGSMTVPVATSPGRSGFGPQLSLSYDSGAGNGPFGFGWRISLPSITRTTEQGLPKYQDAEESDVFVLSGAEDLVPEFEKDAAGKWILKDGKHVIHDKPRIVNGATYHVRRYRPRIEGLFARIERWTNALDGEDVFWRSISKDNITTWYGKTIESRVADPNNKSRIFSWLLCQTHDDKGNAIVYQYKRENSEKVFEDEQGNQITKVHERNRDAAARSANRYLERIRYGNHSPYFPELKADAAWPEPAGATNPDGSNDWFFEVVLDHGEHDERNPKPNDNGVWPARTDAFSSYRAGFEVRTYRLCQRVLVFHHFPDEADVGADCLVRSTNFEYSYEKNPQDVRNPIYSFLLSVTQCGYKRSNGGYLKRSLPPVEFEYSEPIVQETIEEVDVESLQNLPAGLGGAAYQWTDLHGEGIPGILAEEGEAWFYKRNLSPLPVAKNSDEEVKARFAAVELVRSQPNLTLDRGQAQFMDLAGDGLPDVVVMDGPMPGLYEHDEAEGWGPFRPFTARLNRDTRDPNLRFVDVDGDGHLDVLITEDDALLWYPSLAEEGFGPPLRVALPLDEEEGPRIVFADATQSIYLADLSGDGLSDIVRIRNREVCFWPSLGYGFFGAKTTMDNSPSFDNPDQFDPKRIRLADIDGSGTTDIIYLHRDGVRLYFNQSGNSWSQPHLLKVFPRVDDLVTIAPVDLLGNGTACLVWSSPFPGDAGQPMRYVNLMGGRKPHLLIETINNLGAETRVDYAPSTKFYLQDKRDGKPWITRLPFPVHVVERVETYDYISRNRFVSSYAYHHGYFDGEEREFRGFGMVEQFDTEAFEDYVVGVTHVDGGQELAPELYQPPVTTRTWYHTGAFLDQTRILHQYRHEYYQQQQHLPEPDLPLGMNVGELRESVRALKGLPLRQEIYSYDGSAEENDPYTVTENNFELRWLQPRGYQQHGVFFPVGRESISLNYERNPADPRITHSFGLQLDEYGNAQKSCSVVYGRRNTDPSLAGEITQAQRRQYVTYTETSYTPDIEQDVPLEARRLRVPFASKSFEITGITPGAALFQFDDIKAQIATAAPIDYEVVADGITRQKRILSHGRTLFLDNELNPLQLGQWDSLGLAYQSYKLAFTPGIVAAQYGGAVTDAELSAAGYAHLGGDTNWWIPSGTAIYPPNLRSHFYLPIGAKDPFGLETLAGFDPYDLLVEKVEVVQAPWKVVSAVNDYRVLSPVMMTDPNKNRSAVEQNELGMLIKTAIMGKVGSTEGDTLADPTTRMEYDFSNWTNNQQPNYVHIFAREKHGSANPRWQESYAYSNGSGGVAMVKAQAHPGKAFTVGPDGTKTEVDADPRWVGNGRTVLNNKGKPVKQYEPYFSATYEYEDQKALRELGVTPILYYDPVGRNIRTLFPNGTLARVEFNPWMQKVFDANDTVQQSQWYTNRGSPDPTADPEPLNDPERRAAWLAAKHAETPGVVHFDSLGRPIYALSDYGGGKTAAVRSEADLTGRFSKVFDEEQREVSSGFVNMAGMPIVGESAERGRRWTFQNVLGALVKAWDEHGREFRAEYDVLHRAVSTFVKEAGQTEILFNYIVYGDRAANAEQLNLLGAAHQIFDQAGMVRVPELDFKGNSKSVERILAKEYKTSLDWSALLGQPDYVALQTAASSKLEVAEIFTAGAEYDALCRPTKVSLPDATVIVPNYNEANFLASLQAQIRGQGNFIEFLKAQDYDAKGQRQFAHYGNELFTRYFYDPDTFRLTNLITYKSAADPQNEALQSLGYNYDPVGNITQIRDSAQQTNYFNNSVVKPENLYEYDAVYQLIRATGRELAGQANDNLRNHVDLDYVPQLPHPNDLAAVRGYTEEYEYDLLGNIKALKHRFQAQPGAGNGWTRHYKYAFDDDPADRTNRLVATSAEGDPDAGPYTDKYEYDSYGNMTRMPHLAAMDWDFMDQLRQVGLGGGGMAYYVYGLRGQRSRKVIERNGNLKLEWIYLGAVTIFRRRRRDTNDLKLERWTVDISDNAGRIAQVDTKTKDDDNNDPANPLNVPLIRYQYSNHLRSAILETDRDGNPISYEEYHPYGTTSYRSARPGFDVSLKQYRFSGKERDEETGLYYFGARYYASWLGRWTSSDPAGFVKGTNLFKYCSDNPVMFADPSGKDDKPLNPAGEVTVWTKGTEWVYRQNGKELTDAEIRANFAKYAEANGQRFNPETLTYKWVTRGGQRVPVFNAEWIDPKTGQPLLPRKGEPGSVEPMRKQPKAEYSDPADKSTRLTENEHTTPNAQNKAVDPSYDPKAYRNDATVRSPRDVSLDKTQGDNAASEQIKQKVARGEPVDITNDIDMPSNERFHAANDAAGQPIRPGSINRGTLEQMGNRFERGKGAPLPPEEVNPGAAATKGSAILRVGGYGLLGIGTAASAYSFYKDVSEGRWGAASLSGTGFAGGALVLGGMAAGSSTLVAAGTIIGAPAAVIGAGLAGVAIGTYINNHTGISNTAASVGSWAEGWSGNMYVGATFAAGTAIVTAPYYAVDAGVGALEDLGSWIGGGVYDLLH